MKKFFAFVAVATMLMGFAACSNNANEAAEDTITDTTITDSTAVVDSVAVDSVAHAE